MLRDTWGVTDIRGTGMGSFPKHSTRRLPSCVVKKYKLDKFAREPVSSKMRKLLAKQTLPHRCLLDEAAAFSSASLRPENFGSNAFRAAS